MKSEERDQYEEREDHDQSMERPRRSNSGTVMYIFEINFDGKIYVHGQHHQFLATKEKYYTRKDIDTYMYLAHDIMFTKFSEKGNQTVWRISSCRYFQRVPTIELWTNDWKDNFGTN